MTNSLMPRYSTQVPAGYTRAGSHLRCTRCASHIDDTHDDVNLHDQFHLTITGILNRLGGMGGLVI
jgi:hypothetical protein